VTTRLWQTGGERRRRAKMTQPELAQDAAALAQAYRQTFASEPGRLVLADLLRRAGLMQSSFSSDALETAYREGRRRMGLEIVEAINRDPDAVLAMMTSGETNTLFPNPTGDE
jgi:hypothetical protein